MSDAAVGRGWCPVRGSVPGLRSARQDLRDLSQESFWIRGLSHSMREEYSLLSLPIGHDRADSTDGEEPC